MPSRTQYAFGAAARKLYRVSMAKSEIAGEPVQLVTSPAMRAVSCGRVLVNVHSAGYELDCRSQRAAIVYADLHGMPRTLFLTGTRDSFSDRRWIHVPERMPMFSHCGDEGIRIGHFAQLGEQHARIFAGRQFGGDARFT